MVCAARWKRCTDQRRKDILADEIERLCQHSEEENVTDTYPTAVEDRRAQIRSKTPLASAIVTGGAAANDTRTINRCRARSAADSTALLTASGGGGPEGGWNQVG
jgi:hypothetical protein